MTTKQETEKTMLSKTPLRVVPSGELPPADDDQNGTPIAMMPDHDAITRKMPEPPEGMPGRWRRYAGWRTLASAGAVIVAASVALVVLTTGGKKGPASPVPAAAATTNLEPAARPAAPTPLAPPLAAKGVAETIRLEIAAEPMEAVLSLDGNAVAGHRLSLEVPRDHGIHVISATAPGYVPFNQQVSFSRDVVLDISLKRGQTAQARQAPRARVPQASARPRSAPTVVPAPVLAPAPRPAPAFEPGMNLERPATRSHAKPIDERNPYQP